MAKAKQKKQKRKMRTKQFARLKHLLLLKKRRKYLAKRFSNDYMN